MGQATPSRVSRKGILPILAAIGLVFVQAAVVEAERGPPLSSALVAILSVSGTDSYLLAFSDAATASIERRIRDGAAECERLPWAYRYDCLADTLKSASRLNRDRPDYDDARKILSQAGKKLDGLVSRNLDRSKPKAKLGRKSYRPVREAARSQVTAEAHAIVKEAESLLLRSGGTSKSQQHHARIAAAVSATDLLLRSARGLPAWQRGPSMAGLTLHGTLPTG